MKLIRVSTSETVPLEDGFLWADEFEWKPVEQKQERAIDGSLIIQEGQKKRDGLLFSSQQIRKWAGLSAVIYAQC